jgi:hypothetical protein
VITGRIVAMDTEGGAWTSIARENGNVIAPEARRRMLDDLTIQYYYDGAYVASWRTPHGIEILADERDRISLPLLLSR